MKSKPLYVITSVFVAILLLSGACSAGFVAGRLINPQRSELLALQPGTDQVQPGQDAQSNQATPQDLETLFEPFWQAWQLVHDQYVDQPVDDESLMRGAISGMLDALGDTHTSYIDPEQYEMLTTQLKGEDEYEGIGAWVDITSDYLTIISPMPGSPAEKAGLRTDDKVIAVDGEDMTGVNAELVLKRVKGPAGTTVRLTILREGEEPFDVEIQRASISIPSMESRMLDNNIAYVRLFIFGEKTKTELRAALERLLAEKPVGLILDLRYNSGGLLVSAIDIASEFIDKGVIMYEEYGDGRTTTYEAKSGGLATDIPLVVLVNEGSASASEIVAGAIQDLERGRLVGVTTYGKGSVQVPSKLKNDQGAVRITIARWLTPNKRTINEVGLTPDYVIEFTEEDIAAQRDPQLDKAIELLAQP